MSASTRPTVLVTEPIDSTGIERLRLFADVLVPEAPDEVSITRVAARLDAMLVRVAPITARVIRAATKLRHIQKHGVGIDSIDVNHATSRRIPVSFTPEANFNAVAEHSVAAALTAFKRLPTQDGIVRANQWRPEMSAPVHELAGRTVGVVGGGRIGRQVARTFVHGFGMRALVFDPYLTSADLVGEDVELVSELATLLGQADIVSLHVPLTESTRHLIDAPALAAMRSTAILVNTCRGLVVDEAALAEALRNGYIAGAAIDVFEHEPPFDSPLHDSPNIIMSPHFAGVTVESSRRMALHSAEEIQRVLTGQTPRWCINPEVLEPPA